MSESSHLRAYALLILTALIWAGNSIAGKIGAGHIDPVLLTTLRWGIGGAIITAIGWPHLRRDWPVIRKHLWLLAAYGASGFAVFNLLLYTALTKTSAVNVMIEQASIPFFIFLGNLILFRTRATTAQVLGCVLTLCGVVVAATHGAPQRLLRLDVNVGDAMMLAAVILYAGYTVSLKWKPAISWQSLLAIPCIAATLTCLPILLWRVTSAPLAQPDATGWGVVAYAAIMVALVASATWVMGIELIGANRAGVFINLLPVFGVLLAVVILHEPLHGFHFVAIGLVAAGIALAEWKRILPA